MPAPTGGGLGWWLICVNADAPEQSHNKSALSMGFAKLRLLRFMISLHFLLCGATYALQTFFVLQYTRTTRRAVVGRNLEITWGIDPMNWKTDWIGPHGAAHRGLCMNLLA